MKLQLEGMPAGCVAAVIENTQSFGIITDSRSTTSNRCIGRAVCGGRQVEATSDYTESMSTFSSFSGRQEARSEVVQDLRDMIVAMCVDCPNNKPYTLPSIAADIFAR